jgi:hypothetical protein
LLASSVGLARNAHISAEGPTLAFTGAYDSTMNSGSGYSLSSRSCWHSDTHSAAVPPLENPLMPRSWLYHSHGPHTARNAASPAPSTRARVGHVRLPAMSVAAKMNGNAACEPGRTSSAYPKNAIATKAASIGRDRQHRMQKTGNTKKKTLTDSVSITDANPSGTGLSVNSSPPTSASHGLTYRPAMAVMHSDAATANVCCRIMTPSAFMPNSRKLSVSSSGYPGVRNMVILNSPVL